MELPEVDKIERLSLRPGDRLVLSFDYPLTDQQVDSLARTVRTWGLPEGSVIIIDSGARLQVLEAPATAADRRIV